MSAAHSLIPPFWLAAVIAVATGVVTVSRGRHDHLRRFVARIIVGGAALLAVAAIQLVAGGVVMVVATSAGRSMFVATWIFALAGMLLIAPGAAVALTMKSPSKLPGKGGKAHRRGSFRPPSPNGSRDP